MIEYIGKVGCKVPKKYARQYTNGVAYFKDEIQAYVDIWNQDNKYNATLELDVNDFKENKVWLRFVSRNSVKSDYQHFEKNIIENVIAPALEWEPVCIPMMVYKSHFVKAEK